MVNRPKSIENGAVPEAESTSSGWSRQLGDVGDRLRQYAMLLKTAIGVMLIVGAGVSASYMSAESEYRLLSTESLLNLDLISRSSEEAPAPSRRVGAVADSLFSVDTLDAVAARALRPEALMPEPPAKPEVERDLGDGMASYYGYELAGRPTANGERFDPQKLTAAHPSLPMGSRVRVTNLRNGASVVVRINDRGPFVRSRIIDISRRAAREIGMVARGHARVKIELLRNE